ncbi:MAG TPA: hypothetical protein VGC10_05390 [Sphingomonas sp.]
MAYLDTRESFLVANCLSATPALDTIDVAFDRHEWEVIVLARQDGLASLREPSRLARLLDRLFGAGINRRLANPRLEALRRFAVLAWHHGYALPVSAMKALKEVGYSLDHIELLLASVSTGRAARHRGARA